MIEKDANKKQEQNIELKSDEFNEVLGGIPPWILRWGITMVALIILILLVGSAVFKYPDTISAPITLTGTTPVVGIIAKTSGSLQELYVKNNKQVKKGDYLAIIENSAKTSDVISLRGMLEKIDSNIDTIVVMPFGQLQLGNLQSLYSSFYLAMSEYRQFCETAYHLRKIDMIRVRITRNETFYKNMLQQKVLSDKQEEISHNQYIRDSLLGAKGLLSKETIENTYNKRLQSLLSKENTNRTLENLQIQLAQMYELLYDTEYQYIDKQNAHKTQLRSLINQLKTEIGNWEMNYALITPINGKITFSQYWTENQNISLGDIVFNIVPNVQGEIIGKALLPTERSGKVKVKQKVNIRFSNYPDSEYGIVRGYVENISLTPSINSKDGSKTYTVDIRLPDRLLTTYNKDLPFLPEMEGQVDIITDDMTLLERLLLPLKKVVVESF